MKEQSAGSVAAGADQFQCAYLFEAKGIQRWVLQGGRLREIAAASNILAQAVTSDTSDDSSDILQETLAAAGFSPHFSRRAGGAFMLHFNGRDAQQGAAFERFRCLWRLIFMQIAPGLEFVESFGFGSDPLEARRKAYEAPERRTAGRENSAASLLPLAHPLVHLAQRTGLPAIGIVRFDDVDERRDVITVAKRRANHAIGMLENKFCPESVDPQTIVWPTQMEDDGVAEAGVLFPFKGDEQWVAVMHADISALGDFYRAVGVIAARETDDQKAFALALAAAKAIEDALIAAARKATEATLLDVSKSHDGVMPARPVLLGGDDITIILRGDIALPFTKCFLEALEEESHDRLMDFAKLLHESDRADIVVRLTATAGVAFGKAKQPFYRLLELADSLCGFAKKEAKLDAKRKDGARPGSLVAFYRNTESALASDADELFARGTLHDGRQMTMQPYGVGRMATNFVPLAALERLKDSILDDDIKASGLRNMRSLLLQKLDDQAEDAWRRWREIAKARAPERFAEFDTRLRDASGNKLKPDELFTSGDARIARTPLFDAFEWRGVS